MKIRSSTILNSLLIGTTTNAFTPASKLSFFRSTSSGSTKKSSHSSSSTSLKMEISGLKRVVVTGMGITSCLGNTLDEVKSSLHEAKCGIKFSEDYAERGFKSQVR